MLPQPVEVVVVVVVVIVDCDGCCIGRLCKSQNCYIFDIVIIAVNVLSLIVVIVVVVVVVVKAVPRIVEGQKVPFLSNVSTKHLPVGQLLELEQQLASSLDCDSVDLSA